MYQINQTPSETRIKKNFIKMDEVLEKFNSKTLIYTDKVKTVNKY